MNYSETTNSANPPRRSPWNKGKLIGAETAAPTEPRPVHSGKAANGTARA